MLEDKEEIIREVEHDMDIFEHSKDPLGPEVVSWDISNEVVDNIIVKLLNTFVTDVIPDYDLDKYLESHHQSLRQLIRTELGASPQ